ncbi:CDP-alcohol phosphatidyltransferase family protein [Wenyingzhuangia sp. IMCC45574]
MNIPKALILFRFLLAPIIVGLSYYIGDASRTTIVILIYLGLISDILDGIIARKQQISSETLRRLDSQTDMIFWLSCGFATWILFPELIMSNIFPIRAILAMEIGCYLISFVKFKKETCTHAFLSKLWGISLLIAFTSLIGFNHAGIPFHATIVMGLLSHVDRILIVLILPKWTHDVPSAYHAFLIRKGIDFKRNIYFNG